MLAIESLQFLLCMMEPYKNFQKFDEVVVFTVQKITAGVSKIKNSIQYIRFILHVLSKNVIALVRMWLLLKIKNIANLRRLRTGNCA